MTVIIKDAAALSKLVGGILKADKKLADDIHAALMSVTYFGLKDGNVDTLNVLFKGLGKTSAVRRAAIRSWLLAVAPVVDNTGKKVEEAPFKFAGWERVCELTNCEAKRPTEAMVDAYLESIKVRWVDYKEPQVAPSEWDALELLKATIKRADAFIKDGIPGKNVTVLEQLRKLLTTTTPEQPAA